VQVLGGDGEGGGEGDWLPLAAGCQQTQAVSILAECMHATWQCPTQRSVNPLIRESLLPNAGKVNAATKNVIAIIAPPGAPFRCRTIATIALLIGCGKRCKAAVYVAGITSCFLSRPSFAAALKAY
jgi:hypothetical protein